MVVTKTCDRCGDELVIETEVRGGTARIVIERFPTYVDVAETRETFDPSGGEHWPLLYGLVAVPVNVAERAWVVTQYTELHELVGHRLHRVHKCIEQTTPDRPADGQVAPEVERVNNVLSAVAA